MLQNTTTKGSEMMECKICDKKLNSERDDYTPISKIIICETCINAIIDTLFSKDKIYEYFDSILQSRIEKYIPEYNEYFELHNKIQCWNCDATGFINGKPCKICKGIGAMNKEDTPKPHTR